MSERPDYSQDNIIVIPDLGKLRFVGRTLTNQNNLEFKLSFVPANSPKKKVELLLTVDNEGRYKLFDRSNTRPAEIPFDGLGLA